MSFCNYCVLLQILLLGWIIKKIFLKESVVFAIFPNVIKCKLQRSSAELTIPELDSEFPTSSAKLASAPINIKMMVADTTLISIPTPKQAPVIVQDSREVWKEWDVVHLTVTWSTRKVNTTEHRLSKSRSTEWPVNSSFCAMHCRNLYQNWINWFKNLKDLKIVLRKTFECDIGLHQLLADDEIFATLMEVRSPSEDHDDKEDFSDGEKVEKWRY